MTWLWPSLRSLRNNRSASQPHLSVCLCGVMEFVLSSGGVLSAHSHTVITLSLPQQTMNNVLFHLISPLFLFHPLFLSCLIETVLFVSTPPPCLEIICHAWLSQRHDQSLVLFQLLQSCLHLPVGPSTVGKGCSGANYSNGFCAQ